jgi:hypothetical protein
MTFCGHFGLPTSPLRCAVVRRPSDEDLRVQPGAVAGTAVEAGRLRGWIQCTTGRKKMWTSSREMVNWCDMPMKLMIYSWNWWYTHEIDDIHMKLMLYLWNWWYTIVSFNRLLKWWFHQQLVFGKTCWEFKWLAEMVKPTTKGILR